MSRLIGFDDKNVVKSLEALAAAPEKVRSGLRLALKRTASNIASEAKRTHRFKTRTGMLEKAVEFNVDDAAMKAEIYLNEAIAPYAKYVHEGTKPHIIRPKKRKLLRWVSQRTGNFVSKYEVKHPGTNPDRFLYDAAEKLSGKFVSRCQDVINRIGGFA